MEELDGEKWPDPDPSATGLVIAVHSLRKRPISTLNAWDMSRLIGQGIGLRWLVPVALGVLRDGLPEQASSGFYDDDLLTAVLTRPRSLWEENPEWFRALCEILNALNSVSGYIQDDIDSFHERTQGL
ncbi:contact-dependent growth inhibition system immunity protein [Streptomyces peucetius]